MEDKRTFPRANVSFPVECGALTHRKGYFYTVSKDLSIGGIKILADEFLPKNNCLKVNINLINRMVELKAKVIWCNKERISERYSAGLEFMEVNDTSRKELSRFLDNIYNS